jgi:SpoVK/Ycf46/Vps4 family AAA+-type ATPase
LTTQFSDGLFGQVVQYPDPDAQDRLDALVGVDDIVGQLALEAELLADPARLVDWSRTAHGAVLPAIERWTRRAPLFILAGDVGTGKTEVAETIGHRIAVDLGVPVTLYPLSLTARGKGAVGEMTTLLTAAFNQVRSAATGGRRRDGRLAKAIVLLIDEADALAQSRELAQMHHEDRAGVNALLRGVDGLRDDRIPVIVLLVTNRLDALDPAVRRRAARVLEFRRPDVHQRRAVLAAELSGALLDASTLDLLAEAVGPVEGREHGHTYSDLRLRLVPEIVLDAYRRGTAVSASRAIDIARRTQPTPPFDPSSANTIPIRAGRS